MLDNFFKSYFWTAHLMLLAAAGFLSARTVNAFVGGALAPKAAAVAEAAGEDAARNKPKTEAPTAPISAFLERNIFKAVREDLKPEPEESQAVEAGGAIDLNQCEKSSLNAGLVATIVAGQPEISIALFEDRNKKETSAFRIGDKLLDDAELVAIEWRRVLVRHNGRCAEFTLDEEVAPTLAAAAPIDAPPTAGGDAAPDMGDLGKNIKKLSESEYEISRDEITGVLGNLNSIATQARIVPSFNNGKANGFKLFSIRPGSLYSKIGIQNGDIVQRINGYEMNSPEKALEVYSKLKDSQAITVDLVRRGKSQTLSYQIR